MIHFAWNVDVGNVVTWGLALAGAVYRFGTLTQVVANLQATLAELQLSLHQHFSADDRRFEQLQHSIEEILRMEAR